MRLMDRDIQVVLAVHAYRALRREQIERLLFPSRNTANVRLQKLYHHGFLERRWLSIVYGRGSSQAIYLLAEKGAGLVTEQTGLDRAAVKWREALKRIGSPFLEHMLAVNDVRIAVHLAARKMGCRVKQWMGEDDLKAHRECVYLGLSGGQQREVAIVPDAYLVLNLGDRRAHFFLEVDRATESNRRWARRVQAYMAYVQSGQYTRRFGTRSLRILVVTTGDERLANLRRTTGKVGEGALFWFTTLGEARAGTLLTEPVWRVAGQEGAHRLVADSVCRDRARPQGNGWPMPLPRDPRAHWALGNHPAASVVQ